MEESYKKLQNVLNSVTKYFEPFQPTVAKSWKDWARDVAPNSDSVDEYVNQCPTRFVVPLKECLFQQQLSNDSNAAACSSRNAENSATQIDDSHIRY